MEGISMAGAFDSIIERIKAKGFDMQKLIISGEIN